MAGGVAAALAPVHGGIADTWAVASTGTDASSVGGVTCSFLGPVLGQLAGPSNNGGTAGSGFNAPVALPQSVGMGEPSLAIDSGGRLFATAPHTLGNFTLGGSPVWNSTNGGSTWSSPVFPTGDPLSGGDTDLAIDSGDNVFQVDSWIGDSAMAVSTDHGASFLAFQYSHPKPGEDRPWIAYSKKDNVLYMAYDGLDGVHVAKSAPLLAPQLGFVVAQDVLVIPETPVPVSSSGGATNGVRMCLCPPGGISVDPNTGQVYVTYSRQNGGLNGGAVGVARSDNGGLTWTLLNIPGTGTTGNALDVNYNFPPVKVDSAGTVYAAWGEGVNITTVPSPQPDGLPPTTFNQVANGGVQIKYAYSADHGATWSTPKVLSTTTGTSIFPTMDVVSSGTIDVAWYGTSTAADPNLASSSASWDIDFAHVTAANTGSPSFTPATAVSGIHTGCIEAGGATALCNDRSLLDFFQLAVDHNGKGNFVYAAGSATTGTMLFFSRQT